MDKTKIDAFFQSSKDALAGVSGIVEVINELNLGYVKENRYAQGCMLSGLQLLVKELQTNICAFEKNLKEEIET